MNILPTEYKVVELFQQTHVGLSRHPAIPGGVNSLPPAPSFDLSSPKRSVIVVTSHIPPSPRPLFLLLVLFLFYFNFDFDLYLPFFR